MDRLKFITFLVRLILRGKQNSSQIDEIVKLIPDHLSDEQYEKIILIAQSSPDSLSHTLSLIKELTPEPVEEEKEVRVEIKEDPNQKPRWQRR